MPLNADFWDRLAKSVQHARLVLRYPRECRREITRAEVGKYWSEESDRKPTPINLLGLYNRIVVPALVGKNPRCMLSTFKPADKPVVAVEQDWINPELERMNIAETFQRCVLDALCFFGVCKVALATPSDAAMTGWQMQAGQPYAEYVDPDDWVCDPHARHPSQFSFMGHRYRAPIDVLRKFKQFSRDRQNLTPSDDEYINPEGDERISTLGRTYLAGNVAEFEDMADLWEIYLPRHKLVVTFEDQWLSGPRGKPLRVQRWLGPACGPYHLLQYGLVPGNWMGKGPKLDLYDLHLFLNRTYRKLMRQADNQKNIGLVKGSASEDGTRVLKTDDMEFTKVDDPSAIQVVPWNGPNQNNFQMFMTGKDIFSWLGGNLDMLGGLSPQSKTASQDELLAQNASAAMAAMQNSTMSFTVSVLKSLLWFHHHHPTQVMRTRHVIPDTGGVAFTRSVTPQQRQQVPFEEMDVRIDPYSLVYQTPQSRLQTLMQTITQMYIPLAGLMQQQGVSLDLNKMLQKIGRYSDDPDLEEVLTVAAPPPMDSPSGAGADGPSAAPQTKRSYERISRSGRTDQAYEATQRMMGNALGGAESNGQLKVPA